MSLRGNVKLYYIIKYNIFLLFVGFFFYFCKFLIFSILEFVSYYNSSSKSMLGKTTQCNCSKNDISLFMCQK